MYQTSSNGKILTTTDSQSSPSCGFSISCRAFQSSSHHSNCTTHTQKPQTSTDVYRTSLFLTVHSWSTLLTHASNQKKNIGRSQHQSMPSKKTPKCIIKNDMAKQKILADLFRTNSATHQTWSSSTIQTTTDSKIWPTCGFRISWRTVQSNSHHYSCTSHTQRPKQPTTRLRQYYCSRSILYLRHPQMHRSKRKVLDDRNAKFSHPKSTFSPFTKWYWQNRKFCPTSSAPTPQCIRLSERAKFKVPQTQRFGLPAALGSLPTLCSPVGITQTAPVTRKSQKQPTTRLRQYYCSRPILDRPRSQTHRTTRKVSDNRNATLSHLKSTFPASKMWYWQNRKFRPTYFAPILQCIRLRAMAKLSHVTTEDLHMRVLLHWECLLFYILIIFFITLIL